MEFPIEFYVHQCEKCISSPHCSFCHTTSIYCINPMMIMMGNDRKESAKHFHFYFYQWNENCTLSVFLLIISSGRSNWMAITNVMIMVKLQTLVDLWQLHKLELLAISQGHWKWTLPGSMFILFSHWVLV